MTDDQLLTLLQEIQTKLGSVESELERRVAAVPELEPLLGRAHDLFEGAAEVGSEVAEALRH